MYPFKNLLRSYFGFSKKELNGIFVLFILMGLVLIIPYFYPLFVKDDKYDFESFRTDAERFRASLARKEGTQIRRECILSLVCLSQCILSSIPTDSVTKTGFSWDCP
jgi:hypothetical protein